MTMNRESHEHPGGNFAAGQETVEHDATAHEPSHFSEGQEAQHAEDKPGHFSEGQEAQHAEDTMPGSFADGQDRA